MPWRDCKCTASNQTRRGFDVRVLTRQQKVLSNIQDVFFFPLCLTPFFFFFYFLGYFYFTMVCLETKGCLRAKCLNLSKETQIDTLKEKRVLRIERDRRKERERRDYRWEALLKTSVMCTHHQRKQTEALASGHKALLHSSLHLFIPPAFFFSTLNWLHCHSSQHFPKT